MSMDQFVRLCVITWLVLVICAGLLTLIIREQRRADSIEPSGLVAARTFTYGGAVVSLLIAFLAMGAASSGGGL